MFFSKFLPLLASTVLASEVEVVLPEPVHKCLSNVQNYRLMAQQTLNFNFDPQEKSVIPSLIRLIFHARRLVYTPGVPSEAFYWNRAVAEGFSSDAFTAWCGREFRVSDWLKKAMKNLAIGTQVTHFIDHTQKFSPLFMIFDSQESRKQVSVGEFLFKGRTKYQAVGFLVPMNDNDAFGPCLVYLRGTGGEFNDWVMIDDQSGVYMTGLREEGIAEIEASLILYRRLPRGPSDDGLLVQSSFSRMHYHPELPMIVAAAARIIYRCCFEHSVYDEKVYKLWTLTDFKINEIFRLQDPNHPLSTLKGVILAASKIYCLKVPMFSEEEQQNIDSHSALVFLPRQETYIGTGAFTNATGHYRATAFALPKNEAYHNGPHFVFLRGEMDYHWTRYDDQDGRMLSKIPHDEVATILKPAVVLYELVLPPLLNEDEQI